MTGSLRGRKAPPGSQIEPGPCRGGFKAVAGRAGAGAWPNSSGPQAAYNLLRNQRAGSGSVGGRELPQA